MLRPLFRPLLNPIMRGLFGATNAPLPPAASRWMYNFDGVDDRGVALTKAINVDGDIEISWKSGSTVGLGTARAVIGQTLTTTAASQEFALFINSGGGLVYRIGGTEAGFIGVTYQANTSYRVTFIGSTATLYVNGEVANTRALTRGAAREPTAVTTLGTLATSFHYLGQLYDVTINGVLWALDVPYQAIQLPTPTGLGADFWAARNFQVANAATVQINVSGSEWVVTRTAGSALADGMRSGNIPTVVGQTYYFEIDEASAPVNIVAYTSGFALITSQANSRRLVFTATTTATLIYVCPVALATPVTVKVAKLYSASTTVSYLGNLAGTWTVVEGSPSTNTSTNIVLVGSPNSVATRALPTGLVPNQAVTVTFTSGAAGGDFLYRKDSQTTASIAIASGTNTFTFTPTAGELVDHYFAVERVGGNISLNITGISSGQITSNILVLSNTTNERWEEVVEGFSPSFVFSNPVNSQYISLL
jgi:hypothetical protein